MNNAIWMQGTQIAVAIMQIKDYCQEIKTILKTFQQYDFWLYLAWTDIKARYRRTVIGPFWLVIANAITIVSMAVIWSLIFKMDISAYFPTLAASMICWTFISTAIIESASTFTQYSAVIGNINVSLYIFPLRMMMRNFITFLHNLLIFIIVAIFFNIPINQYSCLFLPMLVLLLINFFLLSFSFGLISTRFRDFQNILTSTMTVLVFVTPVMWDAQMLGKYSLLANLNPLTHLLNVIKLPLLGKPLATIHVLTVLGISVFNLMMMLYMAKKYKHRIALWV